MRTLGGAYASNKDAGQTLPDVYQAWVENDVQLRRGQLHIIASGPGCGKSILALTLAVRAGVPALMISPDSDPYTSYSRAAAMLTGHTTHVVEQRLDEYGGVIREQLEHIRWEFEQAPSLVEITEGVNAFAHLYGEYPHLIVVDNLGNVYGDSDDDMVSLRHSVEHLKVLAAESSAAVVVLHHLTGEYESSDIPPPLRALIGKVSKAAAVVITLFRGKYGDIGCCIVKNRFGPADPRGFTRCYLNTDLDRMKVS